MSILKKQLEEAKRSLGAARYRMASMYTPPGGEEYIALMEAKVKILEQKIALQNKFDKQLLKRIKSIPSLHKRLRKQK